MLFKRHGLCLLAHIPQLHHTLVVAANEVALDVAIPANAAELGPEKEMHP